MARIAQARALNRTVKIRVQDVNGNLVDLSSSQDTSLDLNLAVNRQALAHHSAIGQYFVAPDTSVTSVVRTDTTSTQTINSSLTFAAQKKINLSVSDGASGSITRLIELHATNAVDRPWIGWFDQNSRLVGASGFHDTLIPSEGGNVLKQFEIKTLADPAGLNPTEQRTRFAVPYDQQRVLIGFNFCKTLEVNQGEVPTDLAGTPIVEPFGLSLRGYKRDGTASQISAQFVVETETTDAATGFIDIIPAVTTQPGQLVFMKSCLSSSSSTGIYIKTSNSGNPNGNQFVFKNRTGVFEITNAQTVPSSNVANTVQLYVEGGLLKARSAAGNITVLTAT